MMKKKKPEYEVLLPEWNQAEPWFEFADGQRQTFVGGNPWRIAPDNKKTPVHAQASTCESLLNIYPHAIEIGAPAGDSEKTLAGVLCALPSLVLIIGGGYSVITYNMSFFLVVNALMLLIGLFVLAFSARLVFFTARDLPLLFNKTTREVSICKPRHVSFLKFWQPGIIKEVITFPWDATQVRSYKHMQMMGESARDAYNLTLLWGKPDNPRQFENFAYIGYVGWWEDAMLWRLWEHIRRYMEEDGPPIQPGETLRTSGVGKLPKFPAHLIEAAGGPPLTLEQVQALSQQLVEAAAAEEAQAGA